MGIRTTPGRKTTGVLYFRGIPGPVKRKFKEKVKERGSDMQQVVMAMMRLYYKDVKFRKTVGKEIKRVS